MNLSKKIIIIFLILISFGVVFITFLFLDKISVYEKCLITKNKNDYILVTNVKPKFDNKIQKYELTLKQNQNEQRFLFKKNEMEKIKYKQEDIFIYKIYNLQEFYNINNIFYIKTKEVNLFNCLIKNV